MSAPVELQRLVADVAQTYPAARLAFHPLPSGVCFLWATVANRNFVIEYDPKRGTGVSENNDEGIGFVGHDEAFDSLAEAIARFKSMLAEAARSEPASAYVLHDKKTDH